MSLPGTAVDVHVLEQELRTALNTSSTFDNWSASNVSRTVNDVHAVGLQVTWNKQDKIVLPSQLLIHTASDHVANGHHDAAENGTTEHSDHHSSADDTRPLAALYNEKLFHEMVFYEKLQLHVPRPLVSYHEGHETVLVLDDTSASLSTSASKQSLDIAQLTQVIEELANLHTFCLSLPDPVTRKQFDQNAAIVKKVNENLFEIELKDAAEELQTDYPDHFPRLSREIDKLFTSIEDFTYGYEPIEQLPLVLCHGNLSADCITFDSKSGQLTAITGWDSVHYGNIVEDIVRLLLTSVSPHDRRSQYGILVKRYYYRLVENMSRAPKFKLQTLKDSFRKMLKFGALTTLTYFAHQLHHLDKQEHEQEQLLIDRCHAAFADAIAVENGSYESEDDDCFFIK